MSDDDLPDPRPSTKPAPLLEHSFGVLGWLNRAAQAVGSTRFGECVQRIEFNLHKADMHAKTPAERAVMAGLRASLDALVHADAEARELLDDSALGA